MSNPENSGDFKSYAPIVGRVKSKRWAQASNPSYDGDDWDDEGYSDEEEEAPPMPEIPQQFLTGQAEPKPLQLGTSGERMKESEKEVEETDLHKAPEPVQHDEAAVEDERPVAEKAPGEDEEGADADNSRFSFMPNAETINRIRDNEEVPPLPSHDSVKQFEQYQEVAYPDHNIPVVNDGEVEDALPDDLPSIPANEANEMATTDHTAAENKSESVPAPPDAPSTVVAGDSTNGTPDLNDKRGSNTFGSPSSFEIVEATPIQIGEAQPVNVTEVASKDASTAKEVTLGDNEAAVPKEHSSENVSSSHEDSAKEAVIPRAAAAAAGTANVEPTHQTEEAKEDESDTDFNDFIDEYYGDDGDTKGVDEPAQAQKEEHIGHKTSDNTITTENVAEDSAQSHPIEEPRQLSHHDTEGGTMEDDEISMPPPPSVMRRFEQPYGSVRSFAGETDSSASLSTGRRSPDSSIHDPRNSRRFSGESRHERNVSSSSHQLAMETTETAPTAVQKDENLHEEKEKEAEADDDDDEPTVPSTSRLQGRWKPLPETSPIITDNEKPTQQDGIEQTPISASSGLGGDKQDKLEREILGSFGEDERPKELARSSSSDKQPAAKDSFDEPDPEIRELYQNTSSFLSHSSQGNVDYSERIEPLTTSKSRSPEHSQPELNEQMSHEKRVQEEADDAAVITVSDDEDDKPAKDKTDSEVEDDTRNMSKDATSTQKEGSMDSGISSPNSSRPGSVLSDSQPASKSMGLPEIPDEPVQVPPKTDRQASTGSGLRNASNPIAARLNKPPTFDFSGILSKPKSEDRKSAFDSARQRELEYQSGLANWLANIKATHSGVGIYTSGTPPAPTENEAKLAAPSRTMSSVIRRPAKSMANSNVINKVGEKSSKTAKGLLARGKKFMKSSSQQGN